MKQRDVHFPDDGLLIAYKKELDKNPNKDNYYFSYVDRLTHFTNYAVLDKWGSGFAITQMSLQGYNEYEEQKDEKDIMYFDYTLLLFNGFAFYDLNDMNKKFCFYKEKQEEYRRLNKEEKATLNKFKYLNNKKTKYEIYTPIIVSSVFNDFGTFTDGIKNVLKAILKCSKENMQLNEGYFRRPEGKKEKFKYYEYHCGLQSITGDNYNFLYEIRDEYDKNDKLIEHRDIYELIVKNDNDNIFVTHYFPNKKDFKEFGSFLKNTIDDTVRAYSNSIIAARNSNKILYLLPDNSFQEEYWMSEDEKKNLKKYKKIIMKGYEYDEMMGDFFLKEKVGERYCVIHNNSLKSEYYHKINKYLDKITDIEKYNFYLKTKDFSLKDKVKYINHITKQKK